MAEESAKEQRFWILSLSSAAAAEAAASRAREATHEREESEGSAEGKQGPFFLLVPGRQGSAAASGPLSWMRRRKSQRRGDETSREEEKKKEKKGGKKKRLCHKQFKREKKSRKTKAPQTPPVSLSSQGACRRGLLDISVLEATEREERGPETRLLGGERRGRRGEREH